MSCKILTTELAEELKEKIDKELKIEIQANKYAYGGNSRTLYPYLIDDMNYIHLPFSYSYRTLKMPKPKSETFPTSNIIFNGVLYPEQEVVKAEALDILNKKKSVILSMYCGFGKTITAIKIASRTKLKVVAIVNKIVLMNQWVSSVEKFAPGTKVQKLTPKCVPDPDCDFFVINAMNVPKISTRFWDIIGVCIVDECHLIMAERLAESLYYIHPRYLIGLSATPYRTDGLDSLLSFYFGKDKIIRELNRKHIAYQIETGFVPRIESTNNGTVNWGIVLRSQAEDESRNEILLNIIKHYKERTFLVMCKLIDQANYLFDKLKEAGESVTSLIGKQQEFDEDARILIGISSKIGCGFDHKKVDALLLAADLESYFIQVLGRVFRTKDVIPLVFDPIDNNGILKKHGRTRKAVYLECGGTVKRFDLKTLPENKL